MSENIVSLRNNIVNSLNKNGFNFIEPIDLKNFEDSAGNLFYDEPKLFELGAKE